MSLQQFERDHSGTSNPCACPSGAVQDAELLKRYVEHKDESAFEDLLWRHGPMVLSLCRRLLRDPHASEDAFQATFLTLALKADGIQGTERIAGWLYRVAYRIALRSRGSQNRRREQERSLAEDPIHPSMGHPLEDLETREATSILTREIACLPEKFRIVIVLCYLQGKTNDEVAQTLGCPKGTVDSRLARARKRLQKRLRAQGVSMGLGSLLLPLLTTHPASTVSPLLAQATLQDATESSAEVGSSALRTSDLEALAETTTESRGTQVGIRWMAVLLAFVLLGVLGLWKAGAQGSIGRVDPDHSTPTKETSSCHHTIASSPPNQGTLNK